MENTAFQKAIAEIADSLRRWCRGEANRRLTARLTAVAVEITLQSYSLRRRISAAAAAGGAIPSQIALSVLGELFAESGPESHLAVALQNEINGDDSTLYSRFKQVVRTAAGQELFHGWGINDPLGARVWRRLHRVIRADDRIVAFPPDRPEWVAVASTDSSIDLELLGERELDRIVFAAYRPNLSMADLVGAIFAHPDCRRKAIAIDSLFSALRQCMAQGMAIGLEESLASASQNPDYGLAVEKTVSAVRMHITSLLDRYVNAGKISSEMAGNFSQALLDLAADWGEGEPATSFYEYLHAHWPDLAKETYQRSYRSVFAYLAEQVRDRFFDGMRNEYFEKKSARPSHGA